MYPGNIIHMLKTIKYDSLVDTCGKSHKTHSHSTFIRLEMFWPVKLWSIVQMFCVLFIFKDNLTEVRRKLLNYDFNGMKIIMVTFESSLQQTNMCMKHYP